MFFFSATPFFEPFLHACLSHKLVVDPATCRRRNLRQSAVDQRRTESDLRPTGFHVPPDDSPGVPLRGSALLRERDRHCQGDLQRDRETEHQNHPRSAGRIDEVLVLQSCKINGEDSIVNSWLIQSHDLFRKIWPTTAPTRSTPGLRSPRWRRWSSTGTGGTR